MRALYLVLLALFICDSSVAEGQEQCGSLQKRVTDAELVQKRLEEQLESMIKSRGEIQRENAELKRVLGVERRAHLALESQSQKTSTELTEVKRSLDNLQSISKKTLELERALVQARNELALAREQVHVLQTTGAASSGTSGRTRIAAPTPAPVRTREAPRYPIEQEVPNPEVPEQEVRGEEPPPLNFSDFATVEVITPTSLQEGPGDEYSSLGRAEARSRFMSDLRQGDWYRVITPNGSRAFIRKENLLTVK